ncbi:MAG: VacJ family lipoprotein [bacterium]
MPLPSISRLTVFGICLGLFASFGHTAGDGRSVSKSPRPAYLQSLPVPTCTKTPGTESPKRPVPLPAPPAPATSDPRMTPEGAGAPAAAGIVTSVTPAANETVLRIQLFDDPLEPFNRSVFFFNAQVYRFVISPAGRVYEFVLPRFVRDRFHNFFSNLAFPKYFLSALFQGKFDKSWQEAQRFVINSTAGLGGLFDVAAYTGIKTDPEDFGQTLGFHGVNHGFYLVLPLLGPSSARDGFGLILDAVTDGKTYLQLISDDLIIPDTALQFNETVMTVRDYERMTDQQYDPYAIVRDLYYAYREAKVLK